MSTDFPLKEKSRFSGKLRLKKIMISVLSGLNDIRNKCIVFLFNGDKSCPLLMKDRHVWEVV
jgi:hypothetical protein